MQPLDLILALGQHAALIIEPHFQFLHAAAENFGLGRLHHELPFEFARALLQAAELAARRFQFRGRRGGLAALARQSRLGLLHGVLVVVDARLERLDLGPHRGEFDALGVGRHRAVAEFGEQLAEFGLLVGERLLGVAQRSTFELEFLLGRAQLVAHRLVARLEREDRRGLLAEFLLEMIDGVGLLAELGQLRRRLGLHLLDGHFEPSRRHRELGAQLILVGADFGDRQWRCRLEPPHRQAHRAVMHQRDEQQAEQCRDEESDPEIHDRFDHDSTPPLLARDPGGVEQVARHCHAGVNFTTFTGH